MAEKTICGNQGREQKHRLDEGEAGRRYKVT